MTTLVWIKNCTTRRLERIIMRVRIGIKIARMHRKRCIIGREFWERAKLKQSSVNSRAFPVRVFSLWRGSLGFLEDCVETFWRVEHNTRLLFAQFFLNKRVKVRSRVYRETAWFWTFIIYLYLLKTNFFYTINLFFVIFNKSMCYYSVQDRLKIKYLFNIEKVAKIR